MVDVDSVGDGNANESSSGSSCPVEKGGSSKRRLESLHALVVFSLFPLETSIFALSLVITPDPIPSTL